jgi:4a-hydroxytetrahydrobiopterin dehydratase
MTTKEATALAEKECVPCKGGVPPLAESERSRLLAELGPNGWEIPGGHHLAKQYKFPDFAQALAFVNRIGAVAEEQGHHPEIALGWGHVDVRIWTHKIDGLTESDFVLAAKFDRVEGA